MDLKPIIRSLLAHNLNLSAHEVSINGDEILLTALEFKLLKHLAQRRGECKLETNYWVMCGAIVLEITTRTVDTHIKRLREKLALKLILFRLSGVLVID